MGYCSRSYQEKTRAYKHALAIDAMQEAVVLYLQKWLTRTFRASKSFLEMEAVEDELLKRTELLSFHLCQSLARKGK
jgi:hypothetical protein